MGKGMNAPENNLITIFVSKEVTLLYKIFLELIEDIKADQKIMLDKVAEKCGEQAVKDINFFTPERYEHIRKRVLDNGNECSRRLISFLEFFDFIINKEKVEEIAKQKRMVTKKIIVSGPMEIS